MLHAVFVMIIALEPYYEVMNHYVPSHNCLLILIYVSFAYTSYLYPYHELMVQAISDRWCTRVLATSLRMCLSHRTLVLGQQRMSFAMLLVEHNAA
jgi:hypothetical protein